MNTKTNRGRKTAGWPTYKTWQSIRQRCENPNDKDYRNYGARGITVCNRWQDFANFLSDMGEKPSNFHSIERISSNIGYRPSNCRWATSREQNLNRNNNLIVVAFGCKAPLASFIKGDSWSPQYQMARKRIISGWSPEEAISFAHEYHGVR